MAGQCHILGFLEMPVQQLLPSTPGWVSGPPSCDAIAVESPHPRALRQLMAKRYDDAGINCDLLRFLPSFLYVHNYSESLDTAYD